MRIAVCLSHFFPTVGGAERQMQQLARRWVAAGNPTVVLTRPVRGRPRRENVDGIEIRRVLRTIPWGPCFGISFLTTLAGSLVRFARRFDVVLAAQGPWEAVAAGLSCPVIRKPSVMRVASTGPLGEAAQLSRARGSWLWRTLVLRNRLFLAPSAQAAAELAALGCEASRIRRLANGVDLDMFAPPEAPAADRSRSVLFAGRLAEAKNPLAVLRGWKALGDPADRKLLVAGDGPLTEAMRAMCRDEGLRNVEFLGHCDDMPGVYRRAGILVQPSPQEGCSNVLLEAMASGLCPVATSVSGNVELVSDGTTGRLVRLDDPAALAAAIDELCRDAGSQAELAVAAREHVRRHHDLDRVAAEYLGIFREAMAAS
jgi:glycosyltransferase involved in cell wall biosynthesis